MPDQLERPLHRVAGVADQLVLDVHVGEAATQLLVEQDRRVEPGVEQEPAAVHLEQDPRHRLAQPQVVRRPVHRDALGDVLPPDVSGTIQHTPSSTCPEATRPPTHRRRSSGFVLVVPSFHHQQRTSSNSPRASDDDPARITKHHRRSPERRRAALPSISSPRCRSASTRCRSTRGAGTQHLSPATASAPATTTYVLLGGAHQRRPRKARRRPCRRSSPSGGTRSSPMHSDPPQQRDRRSAGWVE